jgi:hypothetical protein
LATSYTGKLLGSASDTTGVTLDGNFNRVAEGTTIDDFTWGFRTTPPNDDFAAVEPLSGGSGSIAGTNENATREPGEPAHATSGGGASIWYRWTAPNGDSETFDTAGTEFDTVLAVYSGDKLGALTAVAGNDDYGDLTTSRLTFVPVAGMAYFVAVDGKTFPDINRDAPPMGSVVLNWYPTPPPVFHNGRAFTPTEAVWGAQVTLNGSNFTGVTRVLIDGLSAKFTNGSDLEITATVPMGAFNGPIAVQTPHGNVTSTTSFVAESKVFYTVSRTEPTLWVDWAGNGFALEYTVSLGQPAWKPALQTPTTVEGGQRTVVVLPLEGQSKFYRWRKN